MRYFSHTPEDIRHMLSEIRAGKIEDLFSVIPENCRMHQDPDIPSPMSEWELLRKMQEIAGEMPSSEYRAYLGAGRYEHYIPAVIPYLLGRSEFSTAYTPYQPEISQGTLQAIYEYQTMTSRLLGMDVANASLYDGASALSEAILMALRITRGKNIAISGLVHPFYREVVKTVLAPTSSKVMELPFRNDGTTDFSALKEVEDPGAVVVQSPNFFGCLEDIRKVSDAGDHRKTLLIACFTEPIAFGLIHPPGDQGADIVCGEGQSLGMPVSFGGPGLGMIACKNDHIRNMPGRLVGKTADADGKPAFVLTMATREQHIRREKATSNICTNSSLCAVTALMFMASAGGSGMKQLAQINHDKAEYLKQGLRAKGVQIPFSGATFNEFVVRFPDGFHQRYEKLLQEKIIAGLPLAGFYPELKNHYLICVTETKLKSDLDRFIEKVTS
ncbi:MAG: aminomethyl-transferring glycine dehydrogenase subunit GcvPA [Pseudomonadota bacterium]